MDVFPDNTFLLVAILFAISLGALCKGMTGLGLPLLAVPALAMLISVEEAVILMIIPGIGANLWVIYSRRVHFRQLHNHAPFLIAGFAGGVLGTYLLHAVSDRGLKILLAVWLAIYLLQYFIGGKTSRIFHGKGAVPAAIGLIAGTSQGATGISAQVVGPYFHGRALPAAQYAFLVAVSFLVFSSAQMAGAITTELLTAERLRLGLIALVPTLIFTRVGIGFADRVSMDVFNRVLLLVFCGMEIKLLADVI